MQIELSLKEKDVALVLRDNDQDLDRMQWVDDNDLLEKFFPAIEDILMRNERVVEDVDDFVLVADIPKGYTTARIARTIIKTLNFARHAQS